MERDTIRQTGFLVLLALVTIAFAGLIAPFLQPLFWASVLAVIFHPVERRLTVLCGGRHAVAAGLTVAAIVLIVFLPLTLIGVAVSREALALYTRLSGGENDVSGLLEQWRPTLTELESRLGIDFAAIRQNAAAAAAAGVQVVASQAIVLGQNALRVGAEIALMLYVLFFFLRDGRQIVAAVVRALPLGGSREEALIEKFTTVAKATLLGTLVVGGVQGLLGGVLFWLLGIRAPVFWGVIMTLLSLLPIAGATLVWGPTAVILIATGSVGRGIALIAGGSLVIGLADNLLRPVLVGRATKLPDYLVLLSTLGGLTLFGLSGFIAGPIVAALFLTAWDMFAQEHAGGEIVAAGPAGGDGDTDAAPDR